MLDEKVLDYMVYRIKLENLDIEEFLANCLSAKDSECANVYFILEFPLDSSRKLSHTA